MSHFGQVAVVARSLVIVRDLAPRDAWDSAAAIVFPDSKSNREKLCPKGAFRGLCAAGLVLNIPATDASEINTNGQYAVTAARLLAANPSLRNQPRLQLWRATMQAVGADVAKQHNGQMDVLLELIERNCIDLSRLL